MSVATPPGMGLIRGAYGAYGRKSPAVKRLVFKTVPDATTRAAMLKNGEVDVAYMLDAPTALELKRDSSIRLAFSGAIGIHYLDFFDQWDPKSPWHDRRGPAPTGTAAAPPAAHPGAGPRPPSPCA